MFPLFASACVSLARVSVSPVLGRGRPLKRAPVDQVRLEGKAPYPPALVVGAVRPEQHLAIRRVDHEGVAAVLRPDVPPDALDVRKREPPAGVRTVCVCSRCGCC